MHYGLIKDPDDYETTMDRLMKSICSNLSAAEKEIVSLYLLAFNDKLNFSIVIDDHTYHLDDVYISQQLKFKYDDYYFRFRTPKRNDLINPIELILSSCIQEIKKGDEVIDPTTFDFLDCPAFVIKWINKMVNKLSIDTHLGRIDGVTNIVELFYGNTIENIIKD